MGLLDGLLGNTLGSVFGTAPRTQIPGSLGQVLSAVSGGNHAQGLALLTAAVGLIQQSGGLDGLLDAFRRSGLASHADSWVATGANMPLSPGQLHQTLGGSSLSNIASQLGLPSEQANSALAHVLPELVNQLTPNGRVPDNLNDLLTRGLALLKDAQ
jgi:uncharacterized protein YidB (DUF937 family)